MYKKDGVVYADAYKYLKHKTESIIGFAVPGEAEDFEEAEVDMGTLKVDDDTVTLNDMLKIGISEWNHKGIKLKIVASRYSNDDQIAIMLNGDEEAMQRMQKWREFADEVAQRTLSNVLVVND